MPSATPVQTATGSTPGAGATTCTATFAIAPAGTSTIFAFWHAVNTDQGISSIAQTNVTWTKQGSHTPSTAKLECWKGVISGTPGLVATATLTGAMVGNGRFNAYEYDGQWTTLDLSNENNGASNTVATSLAFTPTAGREALIFNMQRRGGTFSSGPTGGFSALTTGSATQRVDVLYTASTSGSYTCTNTYTAAAGYDDFYLVFLTPPGNAAPVAAITSPVASGGSTSAAYGASVSFAGTGTDAEDGTLTGASLAWTSNLQGAIGTGGSFSLSTLFAGVLCMWVRETDSGALTNAKTITLTITSAVQDANQSLATVNGGDAAWLAMADYRVNVTDDGSGKASAWDDVRGPGAAKLVTLAQATSGKRPVIGTGLVFTAANQSNLLSALDARLDLSQNAACSIYAVVKSPSGSAFLITLSPDPTDTTVRPYASLTTAAASYGAQFNPTAAGSTNQVTLDTLTPFDAIPRCVLINKERSNITATAPGVIAYATKVDGRQAVVRLDAAVASAAASGMKLCLGLFGTAYADMTVLWFAITNQDRTQALDLAVSAFTSLQFGARPDFSKRGTITNGGTSTNRSHNSTHPIDNAGDTAGQDGTTSDFYVCSRATTAFGTFAALQLEDDVNKINLAHNGSGPSDALATFPYREALHVDPRRGGPHLYYIGNALSTVVANGGAGGDLTVIAAITNVVAAAIAAGYTGVIGEPISDYSAFYTGGTLNQVGTNAMLVNAWYRSPTGFLALPGVLGCFDVEGERGNRFLINRIVRGFGASLSYSDTTYFDGTGHPTDVGQAIRGSVAREFYERRPSVLLAQKSGGATLGPRRVL